MEEIVKLLINSAGSLTVSSLEALVISGMIFAGIKLFKYFTKQIAERDGTIKEMTGVLLESQDVLTKLTLNTDFNKKEIVATIREEANDVKNHITKVFLERK